MTKNDYLNSGLKKFALQDYESAIIDFNQAIALESNFDLAFNALVETYNKLGNLDKAIETAKKFVEISPDDPIAHAALSRLYVQKGMIDEAEKEMAISNHLAQK
jgi:tetratricopeptide (TPR) repeat protein